MQRRIKLFYVLVAAFVIAACGMMTINRLDNDITILEGEYTDLHLEQVGVEAQQSKLKEEWDIKDTDGYIREKARLQGYMMPDEIRFVVTNPEVLYDTPEEAVVEEVP